MSRNINNTDNADNADNAEINRRLRNQTRITESMMRYNTEVVALLRQMNTMNTYMLLGTFENNNNDNDLETGTTSAERNANSNYRQQNPNMNPLRPRYNTTAFSNATNMYRNIPTASSMMFPTVRRNYNNLNRMPLNRNNEYDYFGNVLNNFFADVPIFPSRDQINNATNNITYNPETMSGQTCPITMTEFNENSRILQIRECGHMFNDSALRRWFRNHVTCPVCRLDIRNYTNGENADTTNTTTADNTTTDNTTTDNNDSMDTSNDTTEVATAIAEEDDDETNSSVAPVQRRGTSSSVPAPSIASLSSLTNTSRRGLNPNDNLYFDFYFQPIPINRSNSGTAHIPTAEETDFTNSIASIVTQFMNGINNANRPEQEQEPTQDPHPDEVD